MTKKNYRSLWLLLLTIVVCFQAYANEFSSLPLANFQERTISGRVISPDNEGIPGANVVIKGTSAGTVTESDGSYTLNVPSGDVTLVFSFIGFSQEERIVGDKTLINVQLTPSLETLSEVVVIGYGEVRKSDLTGSVSSIKAEELKSVPTTSFDQALQGRAAGVQVSQTSGQPGAEASIRIRGTSSITAANEPLYVIDGMLVNSSSGDVTAGGSLGQRIGPLSAINPNDIESIEILKDASATAIYGSRGTNGVILITTKRGKKGTSAIDFESYYGVQEASKKLDLLNAQQFGELVNEAKMNAGELPVYVNTENLGTGTDWQEELFRPARIQNYQLSISGGTDKTQYLISGGVFDQQGIVINSDFKRYSFRTNINTEVTKKLSVGANFTYAHTRGNTLNTGLQFITPGVIGASLGMNPILPVYDPTRNGGYTYENIIGTQVGTVIGNPVAEAKEHESLSTSSRILGNVYGSYKIMNGLVFKTSLGIDGVFSRDRVFAPVWLKASEGSRGEAGIATLEALTWLNENTLTLDKKIRENDNINVVVGYTLQEFKNESFGNYVFDLPDDKLGYHKLSVGLNPQTPYNGETQWNMISYLGRVQYSLNNKYLFTLTGRVDGSSKFSKDNKYSFFPSGAVAWKITEESFMQDIDFFSDLKLRSSIGIIGNQAIGSYASLPLVGPRGEGVFNSGNSYTYYISNQPLSYSNPNLKWETTRQFDVGLDVGFLTGRVQLSADYYQKYTYDLLLETPISSTTGFEQSLLNIGNIENRGFDLEITTINTNPSSTVQWNSSFNFSTNKNEITKLATDKDVNLGQIILREGESIGTFYGYQFEGIFQTDEEANESAVFVTQQSGPGKARAGDRKYRDIVKDGVIDEKDRVILGSALPDFTWGFNNNVSFKNFTLSFFLQGSHGNEMANLNSSSLEDLRGLSNVLADAGLNRWTPTNPSNRYPRALANRTVDVGTFSSTAVEDASYVRLKNITLGYNLPASLLAKPGLRNVRVYISATNLVTITDYNGFDPEGSSWGTTTSLPGIDQGRYPLNKTYLIGLNIGL
jgi:TonB-linked SusC/RagA family outer membrane protein